MRRDVIEVHTAQTRAPEVQAVILCGGLGTRLGDTVPQLPKALAPVAGRPFLDYVLTGLAAAGIHEVVLCTGHRSERIEAEYGRAAKCGLFVTYSIEHELLGTAGALRHAAPLIHANPFLLLNGDSLLEVDFKRLLAAHRASRAMATMALTHLAAPERYGTVCLGSNGEVWTFSEKKATGNARSRHGGTLINAGVYALDRKLLHMIPPAPPAVSLEHQVLPTLIGQGLFGYVADGFFIDIGIPEDYERAQKELPNRLDHACPYTR
jgi:NDP-sugar pyrophosphorylase family protein